MTAVPAEQGTGIQLICDNCGDVTIADGIGLHDAEVVHSAVEGIGWTGSAFARGPHRCADCAAAIATAAPARGRSVRPSTESGRVRVGQTAGASLVQVSGDIDMDVAAELRSGLEVALAAHSIVIVDLTDAGVIDSTGLGTLVRARNAARRNAGEVVLAGPSRFVQTVLHTMRLHTAFRVFDAVEQAIAECGDHYHAAVVPRR